MKSEVVILSVNEKDIEVTRIKNAADGCPRYVVSYEALGLTNYQFTNQLYKTGYKRYKGKSFSSHVVIECHNIALYLSEVIERIKALQTPTLIVVNSQGIYIYHGRSLENAQRIAQNSNGSIELVPPVLRGKKEMEAV